MIAVFQNSTNAMNIGVQGYGLQGLTTAQAMALATTGSEWASFRQGHLGCQQWLLLGRPSDISAGCFVFGVARFYSK